MTGNTPCEGLLEAVKAAASAHPDQRIALWFMDEARFGQKGRTTHRWWMKGQRPPSIADKRFESAYIFAAVRLLEPFWKLRLGRAA